MGAIFYHKPCTVSSLSLSEQTEYFRVVAYHMQHMYIVVELFNSSYVTKIKNENFIGKEPS